MSGLTYTLSIFNVPGVLVAFIPVKLVLVALWVSK